MSFRSCEVVCGQVGHGNQGTAAEADVPVARHIPEALARNTRGVSGRSRSPRARGPLLVVETLPPEVDQYEVRCNVFVTREEELCDRCMETAGLGARARGPVFCGCPCVETPPRWTAAALRAYHEGLPVERCACSQCGPSAAYTAAVPEPQGKVGKGKGRRYSGGTGPGGGAASMSGGGLAGSSTDGGHGTPPGCITVRWGIAGSSGNYSYGEI